MESVNNVLPEAPYIMRREFNIENANYEYLTDR